MTYDLSVSIGDNVVVSCKCGCGHSWVIPKRTLPTNILLSIINHNTHCPKLQYQCSKCGKTWSVKSFTKKYPHACEVGCKCGGIITAVLQ